ncbi:MAG: hypothetical protein PHQ60_00885 [Sideroxydans sp.]|nr:hypothetical protein [Sideroxydans sp.]
MPQINESDFVRRLQILMVNLLPEEYEITKGEKLAYQSAFETNSEFETDLCIYDEERIPRVVFEFKTSPTTHDVMVYSQKADDHKRIHPQLVYGMIAEKGRVVATKLWKHNRHMDFALYLGDLTNEEISEVLSKLLTEYLDESKLRAVIAKGKSQFRGIFRKTVTFNNSV